MSNNRLDTVLGYLATSINNLSASAEVSRTSVRSEIDSDITTLSGTLNASYASIRSEIDDDITALSGALNASYASIRSEIDDDITALSGTLNASYASIRSEIDDDITALINGAPAAMNTLKELSDALGADSDMSASLATKITALNATDAALQAQLSTLKGGTSPTFASGSGGHVLAFGGSGAPRMTVYVEGAAGDNVTVTFDVV